MTSKGQSICGRYPRQALLRRWAPTPDQATEGPAQAKEELESHYIAPELHYPLLPVAIESWTR